MRYSRVSISSRVGTFSSMTSEASSNKNSAPHTTDLHVGDLVRKRRKELRISQADLAKAVGLTFQQIQKYERGANRVSASKLYEIAAFLRIPVGYFFDGLTFDATAEMSARETAGGAFLRSAEGQVLAAAFAKLSPIKRKGVMSLVRAILVDEQV
jgi:transcriptional regulator with XRE-family HTH domain